ncbi:MAG: pentapeptide repeat-containing protein [Chloroflexi bacterium]|nr:pentapeptide repeat-containing protein [Chloroflexota bacterium]
MRARISRSQREARQFQGANLSGATFEEAEIGGADFPEAILTNVTLPDGEMYRRPEDLDKFGARY